MSDPQTPFSVRAKAPYAARNETEVSLVVGNTYTVLQTDGKGLWWQTKGPAGNIGWFPASYTDIIESAPVSTPAPPPSPVVQRPQPVQQQPVQQQQNLTSTPGMSVKTTSIQTTTQNSTGKEEVPPPSKPARLEDDPSSAYVLIQIVEGREMKKIDGNPSKTNPVAYIFRRDVMDFEGQGDCIFKTASCKKTVTPKWNEKFQINVYDAESEVLIVRFASNTKGSLSALKKTKTYMGEVAFPLRSAARDFDRPNHQFKWYQLSEPTGGGAGTLGEVKIYIEFVDTKQVSVPSDFKQVSHIGWSADGGFDINNIPPEWKKIFKTVGISKKRLQENPELADQVLGIMNEEEQKHQQVSTNAPPPPPMPGQQTTMVTPTAPRPPPAPVMGGGNVTPPPPPPPGMNRPPVSGAGGLSGIGNVQLNATPQQAAPSPPGRNSLLDQIRAGTSLTKVSDTPSPSPSPSTGGGSLLDTLASALANNRNAIQGDDEDDWSDADDWSDSD